MCAKEGPHFHRPLTSAARSTTRRTASAAIETVSSTLEGTGASTVPIKLFALRKRQNLERSARDGMPRRRAALLIEPLRVRDISIIPTGFPVRIASDSIDTLSAVT